MVIQNWFLGLMIICLAVISFIIGRIDGYMRGRISAFQEISAEINRAINKHNKEEGDKA